MDSFPYIEMPSQFCSDESGQLLDRCVVCGSNVLERHDPYLIDKAYLREQLLYEAVMCWPCLNWYEEGISAQSMHALDVFIETNDYRESRYEALLRFSAGRVEPWITTCAYTGRPLAEERAFQFKGMAVQRDLLLMPAYPMGLSSSAATKIWKLFSAETAEFVLRFGNEYLGVPPALLLDQMDDIEKLM
jgi:hypothetical protein